MPNKDSFTFSDKLRKSKSVPLSKRLPSIVGGQNKQKRTLVQRAQRDLPFILVAACALLLLPFLSKNGSDDIAASGELNWGAAQEEPSYAEGGGADIMPAGAMTDPLDLILRPRNAVEEPALKPEEATRNAYRSPYDNDRDSSYRRSTTPRSSYDDRADYDRKYSDKASKPSTIEKFGKKTRPSVRNSIVRKGTEINRALRVSQMPSGKGGTGVSHALPLGQGPANVSSPSGPNPGVRPIALQPMEARGTVGRSLTGENLYAEAARSINAMNAGRGAKANLLAAQMKDVDGTLTPMGAGGSFGGGGSARPGASGGGPNNTNGYHIDKPWWWDMMQKRSQMWWELFQYKWREMLWTNIYDIVFNGGKQIVNCLLFGSKDVDVSHMFGASSGSPDYVCVKDGKEIPEVGSAKDFAGDFSNKTQSGTKDGNSEERTDTGSSWESYVRFCASYGGKPAKSENSDDGFFKVRGKCLGLNILAKKIRKWAAASDYQGNCDGVNNDPMSFTYTVTKNGDERTRLEKKTVIALAAKRKSGEDKSEFAVYLQMGNKLEARGSRLAKDFIEGKYPNCELTKLIAFVPKDDRASVKSRTTGYNKALKDKNLTGGSTFWHDYAGHIPTGLEICKGNTDVKANPLFVQKMEEVSLWDYEMGVTEAMSDYKGIKDGSFMECKIYTKANRPNVGEKMMGSDICDGGYKKINVGMKQYDTYSARITNPEPNKFKVYAVFVEEVDGESAAKVIYTRRMDEHNKVCDIANNPNNCLYRFNTSAIGSKGFNANQQNDNVRTSYPNNDVSVVLGKGSINTNPNAEEQNQHQGQGTARGSGRLYWILSESDDLKIKTLDKLEKDVGMVKASDFAESIISADYCEYYWCDKIGTCDPYYQDSGDSQCFEGSDVYASVQYQDPTNNEILYIRLNTHAISNNYQGDNLKPCTSICYDSTSEANNETVYTLTGGVKDRELGKIGQMAPLRKEMIPECPLYCSHKKKAYRCSKVGNMYIRTEETEADISAEKLTPCTPIAWYDDSDIGYTLNKVPTLPLLQQQDRSLLNLKDSANVDISANLINRGIDDQLFLTLKNRAKKSIDPKKFELFPKIVPAEEEEKIVEQIVKNCNIQYQPTYENNHIEPSDLSSVDKLIKQISDCFELLTDCGVQTKDLYFYGYASTVGDNTCKTNGEDKTGCNKALSEDRNLYLINKVTAALAERSIGVGNITQFKDYNGFKNTPRPRGEEFDTTKHRLTTSLSESQGEFNLISRPCGSIGGDNKAQSRYVFISLNDISDACNYRVNENNIAEKLRAIEGARFSPPTLAEHLDSIDAQATTIQASGTQEDDGDIVSVDSEYCDGAEVILATLRATPPINDAERIIYIRRIDALSPSSAAEIDTTKSMQEQLDSRVQKIISLCPNIEANIRQTATRPRRPSVPQEQKDNKDSGEDLSTQNSFRNPYVNNRGTGRVWTGFDDDGSINNQDE